MNSMPELKIDWATAEAAKYACRNWHYSKSMPVFKVLRVGVWEDGRFIGVVVFSQGATPQIGSPYNLGKTEICELARVALTDHKTPVSRIIAIALKFLRKRCPGIKMVISFADDGQGHHGGIYQAGGWVYTGGSETHSYKINGIIIHPKTLHSTYGTGGQSIPWLRKNVDPNAQRVVAGFKHKYLMLFDKSIGEQIKLLSKPYPKRPKQATAPQGQGGGVAPTRTLQIQTGSVNV